jgi:hypothetical protein
MSISSLTAGRNIARSRVGAEDEGLLGSTHYVSRLSDAERSKILAMLDFDTRPATRSTT